MQIEFYRIERRANERQRFLSCLSNCERTAFRIEFLPSEEQLLVEVRKATEAFDRIERMANEE